MYIYIYIYTTQHQPRFLAGVSMLEAGERKRRFFCAILYKNASFYQDRLGTNIGKTQKRVAFPQVLRQGTVGCPVRNTPSFGAFSYYK